jgi:hypothetical protein
MLGTKITFQQITCSDLSPQGDGIFVKANTLSGYISDTPFANGTMKAVFEASI